MCGVLWFVCMFFESLEVMAKFYQKKSCHRLIVTGGYQRLNCIFWASVHMRFYAYTSYTHREMCACFVYIMQHVYRTGTKSRSERSSLLRWLSVPLHHIQLPGELQKHPILNLQVLTRAAIAYLSLADTRWNSCKHQKFPDQNPIYRGSGSFWDWIVSKRGCKADRGSEHQQIIRQEDIKAGVLKEPKDEMAQTQQWYIASWSRSPQCWKQ